MPPPARAPPPGDGIPSVPVPDIQRGPLATRTLGAFETARLVVDTAGVYYCIAPKAKLAALTQWRVVRWKPAGGAALTAAVCPVDIGTAQAVLASL